MRQMLHIIPHFLFFFHYLITVKKQNNNLLVKELPLALDSPMTFI